MPGALADAASRGDVETVRRLLSEGEPPERSGEPTPLWHACASEAPDQDRIAIATALLDAGATTTRDDAGETALHAAARRGPLTLVELLISRGAIWWQTVGDGPSPLGSARAGSAADKAAIVELLDRPVIRDPSFRTAVQAILAGDAATLATLLDVEPRLLEERIVEPACYRAGGRSQYFGDPKLFWFIADNPTLVVPMPQSMPEVAEVMIARGVAQEDLDYALELVLTSAPAIACELQAPLMDRLLAAGAKPTKRAIAVTLAHNILEPIERLVDGGLPMSPSIAAALGRTDALVPLLAAADGEEVQEAFALAVINDRIEAARLTLDAGADVNAFLPVHAHSTALHHAVIHDDTTLIELLLDRGARTDVRDKLWNGTPLGWARHEDKKRALSLLEGRAAG